MSLGDTSRAATGERHRRAGRRLRVGLLAKLAITLAIAGAPGMLGLAFLEFYTGEDMLRERLVEQLDDLARAQAVSIETVLSGATSDVEFLAQGHGPRQLATALVTSDHELARRYRDEVGQDLAALARVRRFYHQIRLYGPDAREVVRADFEAGDAKVVMGGGDGPTQGLPLALVGFPGLAPGRLYASRPYLGRVEGVVERPLRPLIAYAMPVADDRGIPAALVVLTVSVSPLFEALRSGHPGLDVIVADAEGWYLVHPDRSAEWGGPGDLGTGRNMQSELPREAARQLLLPFGGSAVVDGSTVVSVPLRVPGAEGANWYLMMGATETSAIAPALAQLRKRVMTLSALAFGLPMLGALVLAGYFVRSIPRLRSAARAVAEGDLSHRVDVRSGDEMEDLARDFNYMAERLEQYAQLERTMELEKLRDDLIHMIVHDLRTPLTSIMGSLLTVESADYDPELTRELLPYSIRAGRTLMDMINDLLDVNKLEAGALELNLAPLDMRKVIDDAMVLVSGLANERGVRLTSAVDGSVGQVVGDGEKLRRVVVNLVGNGIQFTPEQGEVAVRLVPADDGGVHLTVSDTGVGIPKEYHERVFDKFGQVSTRKAGQTVSTGLGLTFCKLVVEAHGGRIWVESEVGEGANFHVLLPSEPPARTAPR